MRQLKTAVIAAIALTCCAAPSFAATPADFYVDLLQKGIAEYNAENYSQAASLLRVAAFGLLEATDRYQMAEVYRTIAADKLKDAEVVRDAAKRVIAAERVARTYASLTLPAAVRSMFEEAAKKVLVAADIALLKSPAPPPQTAQATSPPRTTTTTTPAKPEPKPEEVKPPETKPAESKPAQVKPAQIKPDPKPAQTTTTTTKPAPAKPAPTPATAQPRDLTQQLAAADRAIAAGNLTDARKLYQQLLSATLTHEQAIRVAEGLYRARDFSGVIRAFDRAGALKRGEEPYRFYLAVALYETGKFAAAKKELSVALNYIEVTPDVARYRDRIQGAAE
jgi:outer membrane biosynthesis protein TonB